MAEVASYDLVPGLWSSGQGTLPPQGRTWVTGEKALGPASDDGTLENLIKFFKPQFSYA